MKILKFIQIVVLALTFYILSPVIILAIFFPNFLLRVIVRILKVLLRKDLENIVTPLSNLFGVDKLYSSPTSTLIMGSRYEGIITKDFVCQLISEKWIAKRDFNGKLVYPELQQGLDSYFGYLFWKRDSTFHISNHVKVVEKSDSIFRNENISDIFVRVVNEPFKKSQSPWEILILPDYSSNTNVNVNCSHSSLVLLKVHHALMDGFSMMRLGQIDLGNTSVDEVSSDVKSSNVEDYGFITKCVALFRLPYFAAKYFVYENAITLNSRELKPRKRKEVKFFSIEHVDLAKIKQIKDKCNVSLTSILLSGYVAAIRHFLLKKGLFYRNLSPACMVPVPLPRHPAKLRNHMSFVSVCLPIYEKDPHQRLSIINQRLDSARNSLDPLCLYYALMSIGSLPSSILKCFLQNSPASLLLSNFPGLSAPLTICGNRCTEMFFNGGMLEGNIHMVFSCVGYNNIAKITVSTDNCFLESNADAKEFLQIVMNEFDSLAD